MYMPTTFTIEPELAIQVILKHIGLTEQYTSDSQT